MYYEFNSDLTLEHVYPEERIATYFEMKEEEDEFHHPAVVLVRQKLSVVLAKFDKFHHCTNAEPYLDMTEAWKSFVLFVQRDLEKRKEVSDDNSGL